MKHMLAVFLLSVSALACTEVPPEYTVPLSFSIRVSSGHGAVVGLKLRVTRFKVEELRNLSTEQQRAAKPEQLVELIAESLTDTSGEAHFNLSTPGDFDVQPDYPAENRFFISVHVLANAKPASVNVEWPTSIFQTKQLRGRITDGLMSSHSVPLKNARLSLHRLVSFEEVGTTTTTDDGSFQFAEVPPGVYFLRIRVNVGTDVSEPNAPRGDIPIFVSPDASRESLSIAVSNTGCGLSYDLEENKSRYQPVACFKGGKQVVCK